MKSLSGGSYSATGNPSGAVAKANQNAAIQPPTVIIQATAGGGYMIATTLARYTGNLGGVAGATAKCVAEFGSGWRFATTGMRFALGSNGSVVGSWIQDANSVGSNDWSGWTTTSGTGPIANGLTAASNNLYANNCSSPQAIVCASF